MIKSRNGFKRWLQITNTEPIEIFIKNGVYKEVVRIPADKPFIRLIGESAEKTILTYDNMQKNQDQKAEHNKRKCKCLPLCKGFYS